MAIERVKVCGVKFFKGGIDGKDIDSGKVFIEESLDFTTGRAKGFATSEYSVGKAEVAQALMQNHEFPLIAEGEFLRVTNGDTSKSIVQSVRPVPVGGRPQTDAKAA